MHLVSFSTRNAIAKLARIYGLSKKARIRLEVLDFAKTHPVAVTCRRYGIARSTYYRWKKKFNPRNLQSLEDRSRSPKRSGSLSGPQSLWNGFKDSGRNSPSWGRQSSPSSSGERVSLLLQR